MWRQVPGCAERPAFAIPKKGARWLFEGLRHVVWVPRRGESKATYLARVRKRWDRAVAGLRARGLQPSADRRETKRHLDWFIWWQVGGRTWKWIMAKAKAEKQGAEISTIREGVRRVAEDLGIQLRKGKPGRPPRPKSAGTGTANPHKKTY
jgi:hypothetical protein